MHYEVENTMLVRAKSDKGFHDMIVPLPHRIVHIFDFWNNTGQFIVFSERLKQLPEDCYEVSLALTNDPKTPFAGALVNLGYFSLRLRLANGWIEQGHDAFIFVSENLNGMMNTENRPLRNPEFYGDYGQYTIDKKKLDSIQVFDYNFRDDLSEPHLLVYSWYDYEDEVGKTFKRYSTFFSAYEKFKEFDHADLNSPKELYDLHGMNVQ